MLYTLLQNIDFDDDEDDFNMDDGNDGMHFLCNGILMLHSYTVLHSWIVMSFSDVADEATY